MLLLYFKDSLYSQGYNDNNMISVEEALKIVDNSVECSSKHETRLVVDALNYILSEDIIAPINMPPFRQSAMDGYAVNLHDQSKYRVIDEVKAGDKKQPQLAPGEAVRIFTGAPVPDSSNAIVIQEHVKASDGDIVVDREINPRANIRPIGEQITKGEIALSKGTKLTAAGIGFLATLGVVKVKVYSWPDVCIVATGNELVSPGEELLFGQIYESNAVMLKAELSRLGLSNIAIRKVSDNYQQTLEVMKQAIEEFDIVLLSGGISVGDYDFVRVAAQELGIEQLFYKVRQKPGKPLYFGKYKEKLVFALPGNPASAMSCFYIYVYKALQILIGNNQSDLMRITAISKSHFTRKGDRAQFLKAYYDNMQVEILDGQQSSMLHTFSIANSMIYVSLEIDEIKVGDTVELVLLPTK